MSTREAVLEVRFQGGPRDGLVLSRSRPAKPGFYFIDAAGRLRREPKADTELHELGSTEGPSHDGDAVSRFQVARFVGHTHTVCTACHVIHERPDRRYGPEAIEHAKGRVCSLCGGELA